ncbi:LCP family protein [Paenarthrobacter aurescens]|uniref:Cell envelope-related transcriptional attenuator domain-containing protein n=1 Tax=Paenarthrobacter aurescens TaxID=43663 RepID=A0A4Y3NA32_PAEAU|nr:LCP family protein [Paenarthrobacter aurescens]UKA51117.1 LCP family protein [Arthrobacter sp. FW305-123]MDO6142860.1 LCP family protein [Paenarthrobacter aurescens]MDO6146705.1 LCP family protein [Paenarthrobacter aurescens]MDO6157951.1 LCP family protein [Paenarthrobacter aurescens]MDO6161936.1 LCP family protein [Paenarthrobacter aurescens]
MTMHKTPPQPGSALTDPVRYPSGASAPVRTKRAFVLVLLTLFVPGSAQIVAGDRKLGRIALRVTITVWALALITLFIALVNRTMLLSLATHPVGSLFIIVILVALALGWAFLFLNTLRIIRPALLAPGMRPIIAVVLAVTTVIASGSLGYLAYVLNVSRNAIGSIFNAGPAIDPVDGRYNFLMMGGDAGDDRTGRRPDSLSVISVDAKTGESAIISVPRNLQNAQFSEGSPMRQIYPDGYNCGDECLINAVNTEVTNNHQDLYPGVADPGAQATLEAVSGTLGITVQAYVLVDMDGFAKLIDAMGGIRIKAGGWVPISGPVTDEANGIHGMPDGWIPAGDQKLNGFQALWYGRSREFVDDYARIARQQCVQQAMLKQLDPATLLTKFEDIANAGTKVVDSNISSNQLGSFVDLALKSKNQPVKRLTIGPPDFDASFSTVPDFDLIHSKVQEVLAPSNTPKASDAVVSHDGPAAGAIMAAGPLAGSVPAGQLPSPSADFTPVTTTPDGTPITIELLNGLKAQGDEQGIRNLVATNGQCAPL